LEVVRKPSLKSLSQDVFSEAPPATPEIEPAAPATSSSGKKTLWAIGVVAALLLLAAGGWYWAKRAQARKSRPAEAQNSPAETNLAPASPAVFNWIPLFNGLTLSGWKAPDGGDWRVEEDGSIVGQGAKSHLFSPHVYTNLEFKAEIKLSAGANGGMFFRTEFVNGKVSGYEAQAYNGNERMKTGSLYNIREAAEDVARDETWFKQHVIAIGNHIVIKVNDVIVVDCLDSEYTHASGHLALQHWVPPAHSTTWYRNLMVKSLPDDEAMAWAEARKDMRDLP